MIDPPARPTKDDFLASPAFGRPVADSIIRRYTDAPERADDLEGIPDLTGQVCALTARPGYPPYLEAFGPTSWAPTRVGCLAHARGTVHNYPEEFAADQDTYVFLDPGVDPVITGDLAWALDGGWIVGPLVRVPGLYLVEALGIMWRQLASATLLTAVAEILAGPTPGVPGTSRILARGTNGSQDFWATAPGGYTWSYRSNAARVALLGAGDVVHLRFASLPPPAQGGYIRPIGGWLSVSLLAPR